ITQDSCTNSAIMRRAELVSGGDFVSLTALDGKRGKGITFMLHLTNISKSYGDQQILDQVSLILNDGQRIGLVGANGVGKSTLLKIIVGQIEADRQTVALTAGTRIGYLSQTLGDWGNSTLQDVIDEAQRHLHTLEAQMRSLEQQMSAGGDLEAIMAAYGEISEQFERGGGYEMEFRIETVLAGLRVDHLPRERRVMSLSGGEKARVGLALLLLQNPDLLLLDEPTNHLDFDSLSWLEATLRHYRGAVLIVSHDREFLNRTVTGIVEIEEHSRKTKQYSGDYDAYLRAKTLERRHWLEDYQRQQEEVKALRHAIKTQARQVAHNRPSTDGDKFLAYHRQMVVEQAISRRVSSAEERLRRIEADPVPRPPDPLRFDPDFDPQAIKGRIPLFVSGLNKRYGEREILRGITFTLGARSRIVLVGPNGAGKSTLLKILAGQESADSGEVYINPQVKIGYLDQQQEAMAPQRTVLETNRAGRPGEDQQFVAPLLGSGLFRYEEIGRTVGQLSSGQKRKLQIACLMADRANLLLLDEPTNYVSFDVLESLEEALWHFPGPIIAASHDRRFLRQFEGETWELDGGQITQVSGSAAAV
ncbi:MAG: ABC-F type ribosomal protection protein, partial [Chloroflexi bacterium]|nr:ABC-F type ribosomal protection protein [Chloroflexota bacterium]